MGHPVSGLPSRSADVCVRAMHQNDVVAPNQRNSMVIHGGNTTRKTVLVPCLASNDTLFILIHQCTAGREELPTSLPCLPNGVAKIAETVSATGTATATGTCCGKSESRKHNKRHGGVVWEEFGVAKHVCDDRALRPRNSAIRQME